MEAENQINKTYKAVKRMSNKVRFGNFPENLLNRKFKEFLKFFREAKDESGVRFVRKYWFYNKIQYAQRRHNYDELLKLCFEIENFEHRNYQFGYYRPSHTKLYCYSLSVLGMESYRNGDSQYAVKLLLKSKNTLETLVQNFSTYYKLYPLLSQVSNQLEELKSVA